MQATVLTHPDGRCEISGDLSDSPLYNRDLAPTTVRERTWTTYNFAALWVSMAHCIPTYIMAAGLIAVGMSWWQAVITILLGNTIVLVPILLNSHAGTKFGIPFPVFARAAYGTRGANLAALMRALVACGWFGINAWIGGRAIDTLLTSISPAWHAWGPLLSGIPSGAWLAFLAFVGLNVLVVYKGMDALRVVENWAAPFVIVMAAGLLWWAVSAAHGLGPLMARPGRLSTWSQFWPMFIPALTAMIGFWSTLSLNMPDFTRFGRGQREQVLGQVLALPTTMTVFSLMGIMITSATAILYGQALWDPMDLASHFRNPFVVAAAMITVVIATLSVNIAANVVSPANDFSNMWPRHVSFATGGLITAVIGVAIQPWKLLENAGSYFAWLGSAAGGLGSIAGVLVADYWILRRTRLDLLALYDPRGAYRYAGGWNWRAVAATLLGCFGAWGGKFVPAMTPLLPYGWFIGFGVAGLAHVVFHRTFPVDDPAPEAVPSLG